MGVKAGAKIGLGERVGLGVKIVFRLAAMLGFGVEANVVGYGVVNSHLQRARPESPL